MDLSVLVIDYGNGKDLKPCIVCDLWGGMVYLIKFRSMMVIALCDGCLSRLFRDASEMGFILPDNDQNDPDLA